ncbi:MAG: type IV toxin-antitoxin system AbiEi family antitoxin domain-containing protein [Zhongshania sp.]|nr:type IV toxin-antitoxin system AbiEi family antitoxin domain-containing protein [Zhongshania sp.]
MSVAMKVALRVGHIQRGTPFSITGFYALGSHTSVQKAFSRLAKQGVVERVSKGFYVRPKPMVSMPLVKVTTSAENVAKAWAREHGYKLVGQGQEAAYRLGFQSQAPMKKVFWSNGPSREFRVGNQVVEVRRISNQKLRWQNMPEGALLRGLLVTPPESVEVSELKQAMRRLSLTPTEERLAVKKLCALPLLNGWQAKLEQLGQAS